MPSAMANTLPQRQQRIQSAEPNERLLPQAQNEVILHRGRPAAEVHQLLAKCITHRKATPNAMSLISMTPLCLFLTSTEGRCRLNRYEIIDRVKAEIDAKVAAQQYEDDLRAFLSPGQ